GDGNGDPADGGSRERKRRSGGGGGRGQAAGEGSGGGAELTELMERTRSLIARVEALGVGNPRPSSSGTARPSPRSAAPSTDEHPAGEAAAAVPGPREGEASSCGGGGGGGGGGGDGGSLIILVQVVCSCLRHLRYPRSRLLGLNLLVAFGRCCDDEARLQRLVP
ncbi:unnamed protein product, partial [Ectocarpus fasciculatus]